MKKAFYLSKCLLAASLAVAGWSAVIPSIQAAEVQSEASLKLVKEEAISYGVILRTYQYSTTRDKKPAYTTVRVIQADLQNPHVRVDVLTGVNNQFTKKATTLEMATERGAIAGVNGDFYNTQAEGVPVGPQISSGELMATPPYLPGFYTFAITKDRQPVIDLFTFKGEMKTKNGASYPLGGINKTYYWYEPSGQHSMIDGLYMYTSAWGQVDRSNDGVTYPTEVLVRNGIVEQVLDNGIVDMIPPEDGYILRASGKAAEFVLQQFKVGEPVIAEYEITPADPNKTLDWKNIEVMIGGHTIMVDEAKPTAFAREVASLAGFRARTGVGYSQDGRYVYMLAADRRGDSAGLSMKEFQDVMIQAGVWRGMNLDGGGSTQMVARPLGDFQPQLVNETEYGTQRKIVNSLGVFSDAPPVSLQGVEIKGAKALFMGESSELSIKAYDNYYNPVDPASLLLKWELPEAGAIAMDGMKVTGLKPGKASLAVSAADEGIGGNPPATVRKESQIEVIGRQQIQALSVSAVTNGFLEGGSYPLKVTAVLKNGETRTVPPKSIQWELRGLKGKVEGDVLTIENFEPNTVGRVIARYDGFSAMLSIERGTETKFTDFDTTPFMITFESYPDFVKGAVALQKGYQGQEPNNQVLKLAYDFTEGTGVKAAYADFADGISVAGKPSILKVRVFGDGSNHRLRAEFLDENNKFQRVDLAPQINWTGWKTVSMSLEENKISYPTKLHQIYVVNNAEGQDERPMKGEIALDTVSFVYQKQASDQKAKPVVKLTVDKKELTVDGKAMKLDQAPVIRNDLTLVPIKFIGDALGGEVLWTADERKVTIFRDGHMIEMWVDQTDLIVNGQAAVSDVAPTIIGNRTMVPLRLLSEKLGWKVTWAPKTRSITVE
ncbi:stalk domain-containing protein [Paenibacillus turpanensis]|uniref:stalk domain-containing protein n=1 Tax=Paenibacillus turpanensis TaxID=2689078 RepID=UPI00140B07DF|nr:stalk domain-containing protein [Paenibacillus turpanensis]